MPQLLLPIELPSFGIFAENYQFLKQSGCRDSQMISNSLYRTHKPIIS